MFGDILKNLRISNNMTQVQLGNKIKVSSSTIGMYEQNRRFPDFETLDNLAKIFNVSTDYLLGRTNTQQNENLLEAVNDDPELTTLIQAFSQDPTKRDFLNYLKDKDDNHIKLLAGLAKTIEEQEKIRKAQETLQ